MDVNVIRANLSQIFRLPPEAALEWLRPVDRLCRCSQVCRSCPGASADDETNVLYLNVLFALYDPYRWLSGPCAPTLRLCLGVRTTGLWDGGGGAWMVVVAVTGGRGQR